MDTPTVRHSVALTAQETDLLAELLSSDLQSLRAELYKTENHDWREALKQREALLRGILARLTTSTP
jgi:hypothetical protein